MRIVALLVGLAGCDAVFGVDGSDAVDDAATHELDRCQPTTDDQLRYELIANPNSHLVDEVPVLDPWSWAAARVACRERGMDLAVFNDSHELGREPGEAWPYWIGQRAIGGAWSAVDGCLPFTGDAIAPAQEQRCGAVTDAFAIATASCDGVLSGEPTVVPFALCEAVRPTLERCLPQPTRFTVSATAMSAADAAAYCAAEGGSLLEVRTAAQWKLVGDATRGTPRRYWVASRYSGGTWETASACPGLYPWASDEPALDRGTCATTVLADDTSEDGGPNAIRLDGIGVTSCTDPSVYALCEHAPVD